MDERVCVKVDPEIKGLIPGFLERMKKHAVELRDACDRQDLETLVAIGHKIKGTGGAYGFTKISEWGQIIETEAKSGLREKTEESIRALMHYLDVVEISYD